MEQVILNGIEAKVFFATIKAIVREELDSQRGSQQLDPTEDKPLTLREASSLLNISLTTLHQFKRSQKLPFFKVGGRAYVKKSHVLALRDGEQITPES